MNESENILETERLILRKWTHEDCDALFEILRDAEVVRFIGDGQPFNREQTLKFIEAMETCFQNHGFSRWKIIEKSSGEIIGSCGFGKFPKLDQPELGYLLGRKYWGEGFAAEIAEAAMLYGFKNLGFREIIALTALDNAASQNVLRKIGFNSRGVEIIEGEENLVFVKKKSDE